MQKVSESAKKALVYSFLPLGVLPVFSQLKHTPVVLHAQNTIAEFETYTAAQVSPVSVISSQLINHDPITFISELTQTTPQAVTLPFTETQPVALDQVAIVSEPVTDDILQEEQEKEALFATIAKIRAAQKKAEEAAAIAAQAGNTATDTSQPNTGGVTTDPDTATQSAVVSPSPTAQGLEQKVVDLTATVTTTTQETAAEVKRTLALIWPIDGRLSQYFTGYHSGIDIEGSSGTEIKAVESGTVVLVASSAYGYGSHVIIDHGDGLQTLYAHLSKFSVAEGQTVTQGDIVGLRGSTGRSSGPHLHFEIIKNGIKVNPLTILPTRS